MSAAAEGEGRRGWPSRRARLSPDAVRRYAFERTPLGRRGYVESDVERFRAKVADEIARGDGEKADLREEIERLRNYYRDHGVEADAVTRRGRDSRRAGAAASGTGPLDVQAVNLLSQAQQAADQHIAAAESYARTLVQDARRQYEDILVRAHEQAEEAAARAADEYAAVTALGDRQEGHAEMAARVAYLRTFAEVTQVQMRSILEALRQELDRLAEVNGGLPPPNLASHAYAGSSAHPGATVPAGSPATDWFARTPGAPGTPAGAPPSTVPSSTVPPSTVPSLLTLPPDDQSRPAALSAR